LTSRAADRASVLLAGSHPARPGNAIARIHSCSYILISSSRRRPGSSSPARRWVPAFAGMTNSFWCFQLAQHSCHETPNREERKGRDAFLDRGCDGMESRRCGWHSHRTGCDVSADCGRLR